MKKPHCKTSVNIKDIISIDKESANEQRAKRIGTNYQPYWMKQ